MEDSVRKLEEHLMESKRRCVKLLGLQAQQRIARVSLEETEAAALRDGNEMRDTLCSLEEQLMESKNLCEKLEGANEKMQEFTEQMASTHFLLVEATSRALEEVEEQAAVAESLRRSPLVRVQNGGSDECECVRGALRTVCDSFGGK